MYPHVQCVLVLYCVFIQVVGLSALIICCSFIGYRTSQDDMGAWKGVGKELGGMEGRPVCFPSD